MKSLVVRWHDRPMRGCAFFLALGIGLTTAAQQPITGSIADSAAERWLNKKVLANRVLDNMESPANWAAFTTGAPEIVDARAAQKATDRSQVVTALTFSRERSREGRQSLRMRLPARLDAPGPKNGRGWGSAGVRRQFGGEDWRPFNRLSLWIYPDCPGFCVVSLELRLYNEGAEKLPARFRTGGRDDSRVAKPRMEPRRLGNRQRGARQGDRFGDFRLDVRP